MLVQRLEATGPRLPRDILEYDILSQGREDDAPTLMDTILVQIRKLSPCGKTWIPHQYITPIHTTVYIKIKSHQLRSNGYAKYHVRPQLYLALVHSNHWADKTCELPHANTLQHTFPLRCDTTRICFLLYFHPLKMYYDPTLLSSLEYALWHILRRHGSV